MGVLSISVSFLWPVFDVPLLLRWHQYSASDLVVTIDLADCLLHGLSILFRVHPISDRHEKVNAPMVKSILPYSVR
ncbi:uncharacterized protein L199_007728 [Kwoniella botswanensis]|uniref:uncharacterized protein n=1 Tax=Kwoniella botswanensis TaxID=1268659 RepID=UPI00315CF1E9